MKYVILRDDDTNALTPIEFLERLGQGSPAQSVAHEASGNSPEYYRQR